MNNILKNRNNLVLAIAVLWQFISVSLMAVGVWPGEVAIATTILLVILFIGLQPKYALGLFFLSLPFMVILPNPYLANLPMWRPLAVVLFAVILVKYFLVQPIRVLPSIKQFWTERLAVWDKWFVVLLILATMSLLVARFPEHGAKQIIFLVNIALIYATALLVTWMSQDKPSLIRYLKASLLLTVAIGFIQYGASLFFSTYYFWQYWAQLVSSLYYGQPLSDVLSYSNSWFSANANTSSLRMFGILQDTHAFGVIVIFALGFWLSELRIPEKLDDARNLISAQPKRFWIGLVLLCFAIVASGTRGVWVAMLIPFGLTLFLLYWYRAKLITIFSIISYGLVIVLFILSPWISAGLNWVRTINLDDSFLGRASSIYDLKESSNATRLQIWQTSIDYAISHPLGTGYGNFISSITDVNAGATYEEAANEKNLVLNLPEKFITAHSLYLHLLVELGILGLGLFIAVWIIWLRKMWQYLKQKQFKLSNSVLLVLNLSLAIIWLLAYGLFDVTILNERVLLYLMGLLAILNLTVNETNKKIND